MKVNVPAVCVAAIATGALLMQGTFAVTDQKRLKDARHEVTVLKSQPVPTVTETVTSPPKVVEKKVYVRTTERASRSFVRTSRWDAAQAWALQAKTKRVVRCESGNSPTARSGPYHGLFQMDANFWSSYGGLKFAGHAGLASRAEQNYVGYRGWSARGWQPWPVCGLR